MHVGRKEALIAIVAGVVPWIGRRALAQAQVPATPVPTPIQPATTQVQIADLQKRVAALEALLANQVAFVKDAAGNLTLNGAANVTLSATSILLKGTQLATLSSQGIVKVSGVAINLN